MLKRNLRFIKNLVKKAAGKIEVYPSMGSNTMGKDDLALVRYYLKTQRRWFDETVTGQLNERFAQWNGSEYAFAFMGGRVALSAAIAALGLQAGDEVIVPGYTCIVVPNAFNFANIKPVYADIELDTYGLSAVHAAQKISPKTKAILIHHLYGLVCRDYEALIELAKKHRLTVIEDCAQSAGAEYKGQKAGNLGDAAIYSFEQSKVMTTGQGGVVTTNDPQIAGKIRQYYQQAPFPSKERLEKLLHTLLYNYYAYAHPARWLYKDWAGMKYAGQTLASTSSEEMKGIKPDYYGCKMPAPLAKIALNQLTKIDDFNHRRRANARQWDAWCDRKGYKKPSVVQNSTPIFLRYPVIVEPEKKQDTSWARQELHVIPGKWFKGHLHPVETPVTGCPQADRAVAGCINLPTL